VAAAALGAADRSALGVPMLLTAIDPESEARLSFLDRALVGGRYLRRDDRARLTREPRSRDDFVPRVLPVLAASRTYVDEQVELAVERLSDAAADRWTRPFRTRGDVDTLVPAALLEAPAARSRRAAGARACRNGIPGAAAGVATAAQPSRTPGSRATRRRRCRRSGVSTRRSTVAGTTCWRRWHASGTRRTGPAPCTACSGRV